MSWKAATILGVVAVVAAVVGYAVLAGKAEQAKRTRSLRNLQEWGIALNLHLMDNDNQMPEVGSNAPSEADTRAWYQALPPYISRTPLVALPPEERPRPGETSLWIDPASKPVKVWDSSVFYFNYAMNRALQPDPELRSFRIYELPHPGNIVFLAEVDAFQPSVTPEEVVFRQGASRPGDPKARSHVLFSDGHTRSMSREELLDPAARSAKHPGVSWFIE